MDDSATTSLEQIRALLAASDEVQFSGQRREEVYAWTERTLVRRQYASLDRKGKGLVRRLLFEQEREFSRSSMVRRACPDKISQEPQ